MRDLLKSFLFERHFLVNDYEDEEKHPIEALLSIADIFHVKVTEGHALVHREMLRFLSKELGERVSGTFYRNFPASVKQLSTDALVLDQLLHYARTYGLGDFSEAGHSMLEKELERAAFSEECEIRKASILSQEEAEQMLGGLVDELLRGSRPLSDRHYEVVRQFLSDYSHVITACTSKHTAIRLLCDTRDTSYLRFLSLSDIIKVVERIVYEQSTDDRILLIRSRGLRKPNLRKLSLRNADRRFVSAMIDEAFRLGHANVLDCFERKAIWCGLLHHIHYAPKCEAAKEFVTLMRGKENRSVYSAFERAMSEGNVREAADILLEGKGQGTLLRNLNYLVSRARTEGEISYVIGKLTAGNALLLIQLLLQYESYRAGARTFHFTHFSRMTVHMETPDEQARRRSVLSDLQVVQLSSEIRRCLRRTLANRLGKVYVDEAMYRMALPIGESSSMGGYGVLPKGSRIPIEHGKKIRAFTYWEKVDDIDLSVIAIHENLTQFEFSWRTMSERHSDAIAYSGDQTSGYHGGSEFFDVDPEFFRKKYPHVRYLVFCNNLYSNALFRDCVCRAGYMLRDRKDSGEIFEPRTVESSFRIDCKSTFMYLFGLDLETNEFVWLNAAKDSLARVAGTTEMQFLVDYFNVTKTMNFGLFFEMLASERVSDPAEADIVVSDRALPTGEGAEQIHSYDFERIMALLG